MILGFFDKKKTMVGGDESTVSECATTTFAIDGMHCVSCGMSIDGELEDVAGVESATTNFAKGETKVLYDPKRVAVTQLQEAISKAGYTGVVKQ